MTDQIRTPHPVIAVLDGALAMWNKRPDPTSDVDDDGWTFGLHGLYALECAGLLEMYPDPEAMVARVMAIMDSGMSNVTQEQRDQLARVSILVDDGMKSVEHAGIIELCGPNYGHRLLDAIIAAGWQYVGPDQANHEPYVPLDPDYLARMTTLDLLQAAIENLQTLVRHHDPRKARFVEQIVNVAWRRIAVLNPTTTPCPACNGTKVDDDDCGCKACDGMGVMPVEDTDAN